MRKKIIVFVLLAGLGVFIGLQSCSVNNNNPTVPAPVPTNTPTNTPTVTPTSSNTPVVCATHVILSVTSSATTTVAANYTYVDQFTLGVNSNPDAVTVAVSSASATGTGNNLEIAFYTDNGSNYPGSVIFISGPRAFTASGPSTYSFTPTGFSLTGPGNYWLAIHSSVQFQPNQNSSNSALNFTVSGHFPNPFPTPGGTSAAGAPWSYDMDTCHP